MIYPSVSKDLSGIAKVVFNRSKSKELLSSTTLLANFDVILGDEKWDLIHINIGLGDLAYRVPNVKTFRILPRTAGGVRTTDTTTYEMNLIKIAKRLKQTGAKIVWSTTTPIRSSRTDVFEVGSEIEYNRIAEKVMKQNGILVNDLHTAVTKIIDMDRPAASWR